MAGITLHAISKDYPGGIPALRGIDLDVPDGQYLTIVGPSGSGKSTLLRIIAGLEEPGAGNVRIDGRPATGLPPWRRGVAMVFQDQEPYPHLDVFTNLAFSLRATGASREVVKARVGDVAGRLGLGDLLDRRPRTLSGGERRRVVLGRALARRPALLLLDEPLNGLDAPLRASTRALLAALHQQERLTTLHVTHDQAEALALGDRVAVLVGGRLLQCGTPAEVYDRPASVEVARFIGDPPMNLIPAERSGESGLRLLGREVPLPTGWRIPPEAGQSVLIGVRPEALDFINTGVSNSFPGCIASTASVQLVQRTGPATILAVKAGGIELAVRVPGVSDFTTSQVRVLRLDLARATLFDPQTGRRIEPAFGVESGG